MDHLPYPSASDLPALEIPLLGQPVPVDPLYSNGAAPSRLQKREPDNHAIKLNHVDLNRTEVNPLKGDSPANPTYPIADASAQTPVQPTQSTEDWTIAFWRYPKEQGWVSNDPNSQWFLCSNHETAIRAQKWLYFRLLNEFLGVRVPAQTILKPSAINGETVIDSSTLLQLLHDWESNIRQGGCGGEHNAGEEHFSQNQAERVLSLLVKVLQECNNLDDQLEPSGSIAFSIRILVEILAKSVWPFSKDASVGQRTIWKLGPTPLLADRMASAGWCRFQIAKLWYQYFPSTFYYLASLPNRTTFGGVAHRTCLADHCTATAVNPTTYEPRHTRACITDVAKDEDCSMIGVDPVWIADIILQDSFPLIEIQAHTNGGIELKVHKYTLGLRYVAISHVWSGGLGNARANSMRSCQLRYLCQLLRRLRENGDDDLDRRHGSRKIGDGLDDLRVRLGFDRKDMPLLIWIDTLCVPVGTQHTAAYTKTLYRMAQIYVTAQCALVLDPELQNMNHRTMQVEQIYAHVLCSSWMSRSWTFQEACMARIWFVEFADGYFAVDEHYIEFQKRFAKPKGELSISNPSRRLSSNLRKHITPTGMQSVGLMDDVTRWFREMPVLAKIRYGDPRELMNKLEDWQNFAFAWNGLRDRSTTKAEDLYGIIAVVVDLSAGDVLKLPREERLKAIFRSQNSLPLSLLYQTSPKLCDTKGQDTWSPAGIIGDRLNLNSGYMTVGAEGLSIEPSRWMNMNRPQGVLLGSVAISHRYFDVEFSGTQTRRMIELVMESPKLERSERSLCCIYDGTLLRNIPGLGTFAPGVCLTVDSQKDHVYHTSYACPIRVFSSCTPIAGASASTTQKTSPNSKQVSGSPIDWQQHSIIMKSGKCDTALDAALIDFVLDFAHWPPPLPHVSKRALSRRVIVRNTSNWIEFSSIGLISGPYLIGIIICAVHRQGPTASKLFWLCLSRWLSLWIEFAWAGASLAHWDRHRTVDWTNRLYGTTKKPRLQHLSHLIQYPAFLARLPPLTAASVFLALYRSHRRSSWMKIYAIVLFSEVGLSLTFTLLVMYSMFLSISHGWYQPMTRNLFADQPEILMIHLMHSISTWKRGGSQT